MKIVYFLNFDTNCAEVCTEEAYFTKKCFPNSEVIAVINCGNDNPQNHKDAWLVCYRDRTNPNADWFLKEYARDDNEYWWYKQKQEDKIYYSGGKYKLKMKLVPNVVKG